MPPVKKAKAVKDSKHKLDEENPTAVVSGQLEKKIKKQKQKIDGQRGVVFIKHLPHGFFEEQLKKYFQQFGNVTRLRLVRSKRTGGSKGFAFVEFEYPEVAQVAAETMDSYLMFKKVVKAVYIPPEQQRFNYFKTSLRKVKNKAGKDIYVSGKSAAIQRKIKQQNDWSDESYQSRTETKLKKIEILKKKYAHLGIDFSSIVVMPKQVNATEKTSMSESAIAKSKNIAQLKNGSKHKIVKEVQKPKSDVRLEDLLGNTINEDSDDEDWQAKGNDSDDDGLTSDEETYGFQKESDTEDDDVYEENSEIDEDHDIDTSAHKSKTGAKSNIKKSNIKKSKQPPKVDSFDKLLKRKSNLGGIQKPSKKFQKKTVVSKSKKNLQVAAVKELKPKRILKKSKAS